MSKLIKPTRRSFLKTSAALGATSAISSGNSRGGWQPFERPVRYFKRDFCRKICTSGLSRPV
ncbi:twin-arginine translocation signal domain-containing protein [Paracoccaceae bacterium]|nr:twin-arginine translocation signal domain-containing protein [Paracoccaceae bacterium]